MSSSADPQPATSDWGAPAQKLAEQFAAGAERFRPGPALTSLCNWFVSEDALVIVVPPDGGVDATDRALPYALAWQGDRDLFVIAPTLAVTLTLERVAWIRTPVTVIAYDGELHAVLEVVPARAEVLDAARNRPVRTTVAHDLEERSWLVDGLVDWADGHWALSRAPRASYLAWHCLGRQVLTVRRSRKGVRVTSGVKHAGIEPAAGSVAELTEGPMTAVERAGVEAAVAAAVAERYNGADKGHDEHRMQAALAAIRLGPLGIDRFAREYPAWRGPARAGFIDFLGVDRHNRLHVVETKVGSDDPGVVLQALDYTTWVSANAARIRGDLGWPIQNGAEGVIIDLVVAPKQVGGQVIGTYLAGQLEALSGDLRWRISVVVDPLAAVLEVLGPFNRLPTTEILPGAPMGEPVRGPRWTERGSHPSWPRR